jgi:hypothetical protein
VSATVTLLRPDSEMANLTAAAVINFPAKLSWPCSYVCRPATFAEQKWEDAGLKRELGTPDSQMVSRKYLKNICSPETYVNCFGFVVTTSSLLRCNALSYDRSRSKSTASEKPTISRLQAAAFRLKMEAIPPSEMFVDLYRTTWRYNRKDCSLYTWGPKPGIVNSE